MTKGGRAKKVPSDEWRGRLANARAFLQAAGELLTLAEEGSNGNPIMSQAINAAIAYADALTIRFAGVHNTGAHQDAPRALRQALGERADAAQLQRLVRIIARKDAAQYGHRRATMEEARQLVEQCERFAAWAEQLLAVP